MGDGGWGMGDGIPTFPSSLVPLYVFPLCLCASSGAGGFIVIVYQTAEEACGEEQGAEGEKQAQGIVGHQAEEGEEVGKAGRGMPGVDDQLGAQGGGDRGAEANLCEDQPGQ